MPEHEPVAIAEAPSEGQVNQLIWADQGVKGKGLPRTWRTPTTDKVVLTSDDTGINVSLDDGTTAPSPVIVEGTPAGGNLAGTYPNPIISEAALDVLFPPGTVWAYAGFGVPFGWLACDGAAVSTTTYAKLFAVIGTTYGAAGAGTFRVPNLAGRVALGVSGTHPLSQLGGNEAITGPAHTHDGSHSHGLNGHTHGLAGHGHSPGGHSHGLALTHVHAPGGHSHDISTHRHDIGHEHLSPPTHPAVTLASATVLNGRFTAGGANALPDAHTHPYDVPALGITNSGISSAPGTGPPSASDTGAVTGTPSTGTPSADVTGPPQAPVTDTTAPAPTVTAADTTAPAAVYPSTVPTMMPFTSLQFIIRTG